MCPQSERRNKKPGWTPACLWEVTPLDHSCVHRHQKCLEKRWIVRMEEVMDAEPHFNWTRARRRSFTPHSAMVCHNLKRKKNTTTRQLGGTEFRRQVTKSVGAQRGTAGTLPRLQEGISTRRVEEWGAVWDEPRPSPRVRAERERPSVRRV